MGTYRPSERKNRSLSDMFSEAEDEHFLDCQTADFFIRCGSTLLDCILCFLITSGVQHLANTAYGLVSWQKYGMLIYYGAYGLKIFVYYMYFIWTLMVFRGTPAKLLLGLRVVDADSGAKLSFFRVMVREVFGKALGVASLGIGFLFAMFRKDHRALHDLLSNSVVKRLHGS